jgi:cell division protein FtsW (lipid II flippase)
VYWEARALQRSNSISAYLEVVRQQIRWKKAQPIVLEEVEHHIFDQTEALLDEGLDEETATARAIAEMGGPVEVGAQLDSVHRPKPDWGLLVLTGAMLLVGLVIQYIVCSAETAHYQAIPIIGDIIGYGVTSQFGKQAIWSGVAILALIVAYFADFTILRKHPYMLFLALCVLAIVCYSTTSMVLGRRINAVYPLMLVPVAYVGIIYSMRNKGMGGVLVCGVSFMLPAIIALFIPSITMLSLLCICCLTLLTTAVCKNWFHTSKWMALSLIYVPVIMVFMGLVLALFGSASGSRRLQANMDPALEPTGVGYLASTIDKVLSHSRPIGQGLPLSEYGEVSAARILPSYNFDFLLTYLTYNYGWILFIGVVVLFVAFTIRAGRLCKKQQSILGQLTALAVVTTIAMQCMVYFLANLGFLLLSPLSLPLISYGGQALVVNMFMIGLLLSVFRTGSVVRDTKNASVEDSNGIIRYENGQIIINIKG